jgi:hypothetical protein
MLSERAGTFAFIPIIMSAAAITIVVIHVVTAGTAPQVDEGVDAHLWQLLMAGQLPLVAFFALAGMPRDRSSALRMLGLQVAVALVAITPVYLLHW